MTSGADVLPGAGVELELGRLGPIVLEELSVIVGGIYVIISMLEVIVSTLNTRYTLGEGERGVVVS